MYKIPKRLLFLDIDGVIVTRRSWYALPYMDSHNPDVLACEFLKHFCYHQCYKIVISSTWKRHFHMLHKLLWDTGLVHYLVDPTDFKKSSTPSSHELDMPPTPEHGEEDGICFGRSFEIKAYMDSVGFVLGEDEAIVIDDDIFDTKYWNQRENKIAFIHTHFDNGITCENMDDMLSFAKNNYSTLQEECK